MSAYINGVYVATTSDLENLEGQLRELLRQVEQNTRSRDEEQLNRIRAIEGNLRTEGKRIDELTNRLQALDKALKDAVAGLEKTLEEIGDEVQISVSTLSTVNTHLVKNIDQFAQLISATQEEAQLEVDRRKELDDRLGAILKEQQARADVLQKAFASFQAGIERLVTLEEKGSQTIEQSIRGLQDVLIQLQSLTQADLAQISQAIQDYELNSAQRTDQQREALDGILQVQSRLETRLMAIQSITDNLAQDQQALEKHHADRDRQDHYRQALHLNQLALTALHHHHPDLAVKLLDQAEHMAPGNLEILYNRALACQQAGQYDRAKEQLVQLRASHPQDSRIPTALGILSLAQGQPAEAINYLRTALALDNQNGAAWYHLGNAHFSSGAVDPALQAWKQAQAFAPGLIANDPGVRLIIEE